MYCDVSHYYVKCWWEINRPFAWWRRDTTTTRILSEFFFFKCCNSFESTKTMGCIRITKEAMKRILVVVVSQCHHANGLLACKIKQEYQDNGVY
jgi:hypothetical protein